MKKIPVFAKFNKRIDYLLTGVSGTVLEKHKKGWSYSKDNPLKRINKLLDRLKKTSSLTDAEKQVNEIISICLAWKYTWIDWEEVEKK